MPLAKKTVGVVLRPVSETELATFAEAPLKDTPYYHFLRLVASALDEAVKGSNCYITVGTTKSADAVMLTLHQGAVKTPAFGSSLASLGESSSDLLDPF